MGARPAKRPSRATAAPHLETLLWRVGIKHLAGVDEVGMGPLAGPVVAAAVVFPPGTHLDGVADSKVLTAQARERLDVEIRRRAVAVGIAIVEPEEIDRVNIYWAGILAMQRAAQGLGVQPQHLLIDARRLRELSVEQTRIVKGDELSLSIAAASILAKTERDRRMLTYDAEYPAYGFAQHKGYPVRQHLAALAAHGPCPIHRRSFAPVREALGLPPLPPWPVRTSSVP